MTKDEMKAVIGECCLRLLNKDNKDKEELKKYREYLRGFGAE